MTRAIRQDEQAVLAFTNLENCGLRTNLPKHDACYPYSYSGVEF
jgi:hypothetical protein